MQFRSHLAELWFETSPKWFIHLKELSEYILLPDFSLVFSNIFFPCPFVSLSLKRVKIDFTRKIVEMIMYLQFILIPLEMEFVSHTNSIISVYVLSTWNIHPLPYFCWKNPHLGQWSKRGQNVKIRPQTQWFDSCNIFNNLVKKKKCL